MEKRGTFLHENGIQVTGESEFQMKCVATEAKFNDDEHSSPIAEGIRVLNGADGSSLKETHSNYYENILSN